MLITLHYFHSITCTSLASLSWLSTNTFSSYTQAACTWAHELCMCPCPSKDSRTGLVMVTRVSWGSSNCQTSLQWHPWQGSSQPPVCSPRSLHGTSLHSCVLVACLGIPTRTEFPQEYSPNFHLFLHFTLTDCFLYLNQLGHKPLPGSHPLPPSCPPKAAASFLFTPYWPCCWPWFWWHPSLVFMIQLPWWLPFGQWPMRPQFPILLSTKSGSFSYLHLVSAVLTEG